MKLTCFIIDDEPLAIEVLESHIEKIDRIEIVGTFTNSVKAFEALHERPVDLLFLDIQMPRLSGLELVKTLSRRPKVIFTTAYREHAVEGFELDVVDYLLKPISFERFLKAINKVFSPEEAMAQSGPFPKKPDKESFLFVQVDKKRVRINLDEILFIESQRDYVKIITTEKEILAHQKISSMEEKLPGTKFLRIHRSYIVAIDKIESWSAGQIELPDKDLPIGRTYKNNAIAILEDRSRVL